MTTNQLAIEAYLNFEYEKAFSLFLNAVQESRNVESLTNLAFYLWAEQEDEVKTLDLLEETITLGPVSHLPYSLLGEIYTKQEKWLEAQEVLTTALKIEPTKAAYNNLAVCRYHMGNLEEAAAYFLLASEASDYTLYSYAQCLIKLGNKAEAVSILNTFSDKDEEFVGEVELAEVYLETEQYDLAVEWFKKGWDIYMHDPSWIHPYVYALIKLDQLPEAQEVINKVLAQNEIEIEEIKNQKVDENWTSNDKKEVIEEYLHKQKAYESIWNLLLSDHIAKLDTDFEPAYKSACYLIGCTHPFHAN